MDGRVKDNIEVDNSDYANNSYEYNHTHICQQHSVYGFLDTLRVDGDFRFDGVFDVCAGLLRLRAGGSSDLLTTIKSGI